MKETLEELIKTIGREKPHIGKALYSHNIVSLTLSQIASEYGMSEANKVIDRFRLERLGWKKEEE